MLNAESLTALAWWPHQCQEGLIGDIALQLVVEVLTLLLLQRLLLPLLLLLILLLNATISDRLIGDIALQLLRVVTIGGEHWAGVETKSNKWNNYFSLTLTSFLFVFPGRMKRGLGPKIVKQTLRPLSSSSSMSLTGGLEVSGYMGHARPHSHAQLKPVPSYTQPYVSQCYTVPSYTQQYI